MEWYKMVLQKYAVFSGRSRRKEFWMFALFNWIIALAIGFVAGILGNIDESLMSLGMGLSYLYSFAILVPALAVEVRRLHDVGKSGWWIFIALIPIVGIIWLIILFATEGQPGENQYGPNPKEAPIL